MTPVNSPVANFTISDAAKRGIELVRVWFNKHSSDQAAVPTVGWVIPGQTHGDEAAHIAVTFYGRSQYDEIASAIQTVSGIDIVFLPAPGDYAKTDGKVLDYADGRGFFLRMQ